MKKVLLLFFICVSSSLFAQRDTIGNFIKDGTTLIWQKVYYFDKEKIEDVNNFFKHHPGFYNSQSGWVSYPILKNFCDVAYGERPVFFNNEARTKFIIQVKEDRYRITVTSIEARDTYGNFTFASSAMLNMQDYENAKYLSNMFDGGVWFKKNGELRPMVYEQILPILDECLIKLFNYEYKDIQVIDDNF